MTNPVQWEPGDIFLGVNWPRNKVDHSPLSRSEIQNK